MVQQMAPRMSVFGLCFLLCISWALPGMVSPYEISFNDVKGVGRTFEGIGAISGGGATSKLLVNYPEKERDEILDYLFLPNFAASLQIFKVEIGGDVQSTDGSEPSHMHVSWEENYERGYEWWLLQEAKKRNPDIKIYALPWGFPGWVGQGTDSPYNNIDVTADYVVRWVEAARRVYKVEVDYIGIWNERDYTVDYIKTLRRYLDNKGFTKTQIIAPDSDWRISGQIIDDPKLAEIVHAIGAHYPGTNSSDMAKSTKKPLWASEDYSTYNDNVGGGCWARILNQNYVNGLMTSTISWNLISSYYPELPYMNNGLMNAYYPWSGSYEVMSPIWISAHTTQFVPIGWTYLKHGAGVGKLKYGGSYVALTNADKSELTIVIETMSHDHSKCIRPPLPKYDVENQTITISFGGSFSKISELNVWYSKLGFDGNKTTLFEKRDPVAVKDGKVTVELKVDEVYTLTTQTVGQKGSRPTPPGPKPFPFPYSDNFESYKEYNEPSNISPQIGSFEVIQGANSNKVLRQTVQEKPVQWCAAEDANRTLSVVGSFNWTDIYVEVDFEIAPVNGTKGVFIGSRVNNSGCKHLPQVGGVYFFALDGQYVVATDNLRQAVVKSGPLPSSAGWHKMSLSYKKGVATGFMDKKQVFEVEIDESTVPPCGWAAIGTDSWGVVDFDNLRIDDVNKGLKEMKTLRYNIEY